VSSRRAIRVVDDRAVECFGDVLAGKTGSD
jgi:hypothetical protein